MKHCPPTLRRLMIFILLGCFGLQTWLIYSDDTGHERPPLSHSALRGRILWAANNCQSCHQLYGFGGFLGPDLTNRASVLPQEAFEAMVKLGPRQMPSFFFSKEQFDDLYTFLKEMDQTGRGQPRVSYYNPPGDPSFRFEYLPWFTY